MTQSEKPSPQSLLRRFFEGLVQNAFFERLGVPDPRLADYLADLLCRFVRVDAIFGMRDVQGRRLEEVAQMLAEASGPSVRRQRERAIHKHIGDFVLFWSGVYPEFLRWLRAPSRKDHLIDYTEQGRRSYYIASTFDLEPFRREAPVLRKLSAELELCVFGLSLVREGWESQAPETYRGFRSRW
jgi:hypothetical protein